MGSCVLHTAHYALRMSSTSLIKVTAGAILAWQGRRATVHGPRDNKSKGIVSTSRSPHALGLEPLTE